MASFKRDSPSGSLNGALSVVERCAGFSRRAQNPAPRSYKVPPTVESLLLVSVVSPAERLEGPSPGNIVLLYLHGGGYFACSRDAPAHYRFLCAPRLPRFCSGLSSGPRKSLFRRRRRRRRFLPCLLTAGYPPGNIVVAGESAGGGLSLSLMLALRDADVPLPAAAALFSMDRSCRHRRVHSHQQRPLRHVSWCRRCPLGALLSR